MSKKYNREWLEAAYDHFGQAVLHGDVHLAKDIIADTFDAGFSFEAQAMANILRREETQEILARYSLTHV